MTETIEHIALSLVRPETVKIKRIPIVVPPTPTHLSPGVEYLTDSPFGGEKTITQSPPNPYNGDAPDAAIFRIPVRNIASTWVAPGGSMPPGSGVDQYKYKTPSEALAFSIENSAVEATAVDTSNIINWPYEADDMDDLEGNRQVHPDILDKEDLFTDLWCLHAGTTDYPGFGWWYLNRVPAGISITETDRMCRFDTHGLPTFYSSRDVVANLIPCYVVHLFIDMQDYTLVTDPDGGSHMEPWGIASYDVRSLFAQKVATSNSTFFKKFRECKASNPALASVYARVMSTTGGYGGAGAGLVFYTDTF